MGRLDQYNADYQAATPKDPGANLPDGVYEFYVKNAYATVTKTSNRDTFKWELCVNEPAAHRGRMAWRSDYFDKTEHLEKLRFCLKVLGYENMPLGELEDAAQVKKLLGLRIRGQVKQGKNLDFPPYVNFKALLEGTGPVAGEPAGAAVGAGAGREPGDESEPGSALGEDAPF